MEQDSLFRQWLTDHKGIMLKVARSYALAQEDQDDLFQEILFQVWRCVPRFRGDAKPSTWIYKVALNAALAWRRSQRRHRRPPQSGQSTPEAHPSDSHENQEAIDWLYGEIRKLPEVDSALVLLYLDGVSYRDMSDILGISESNVGVKLNRIRKSLAQAAKEAGHGS